jgi:hypothetical protein
MAEIDKHEQFEAIRQFTAPPDPVPRKIGFGVEEPLAVHRRKNPSARPTQSRSKRRTR